MDGVVVLDDEEDREPSLDEVREYGEFLGMDCDKEPHLMWIAQQGVVAKVPPPWKACLESGGAEDVFYFNFETRESVWEHPCDDMYRKMLAEYRAKSAAAPPADNGEKAASDSGSGLDDIETDEELAEQEEKLLRSDPRDLEAKVHTMMWDTTPNPSPLGKGQIGDLTKNSPVSGGTTVRALDNELNEEEEKDEEEEEEEEVIYVDENYSPTLRGSKTIKLGSLKEEKEEDESRSSAVSTPARSPNGPDADARMEAQKHRLQLITNELSDDESLSRSSTPLNSSIDSVGARAAQSDHSSLGKAASSKPALACACGSTFATDAAFCRKCGRRRPLVASACSCGNAFLPDAKFCRKCGRKRLEVGHSPGSPSGGKMSRRAQEVSAGATMTIQRMWRGVQVRRKFLKRLLLRRRLAGQCLAGSQFNSGAIRLRHGERHLRSKERCHGPNHPEVAPALLRIADIHQVLAGSLRSVKRTAMHKKRLDTLERALCILEEHHGHSSVELVDVLSSLAGARRALNYFEEEQQVLSRIASIEAAQANRGSAGVGLVASPQAGLTIDTFSDQEDDITEDMVLSSPRSANLSNQSQSHSGGRAIPAGPGKAVAVARQLLGLEHSGHSGQSGKSSNLSEVSEDFPSDFDVPSPELAPAVLWNAPLGDSLELSATGTMEEGLAAAAYAATADIPTPGLAAAAVAKVAGFSPLGGADEVSVVHKPVQDRVQSVKADIQSLTRILSALREIRVQQGQYLNGLKVLAAGSSSLIS